MLLRHSLKASFIACIGSTLLFFVAMLFAPATRAALINGPGVIGPELAVHTEGTDPGRDVVDANDFKGVVSVINNPDWDSPHNTVPSRSNSPVSLRIWVEKADAIDPSKVLGYASKLTSQLAQSEFPGGVVAAVLNVEMNNLDWWGQPEPNNDFDKQCIQTMGNSKLYCAGLEYGNLFIKFAQAIPDTNTFPPAPAPPDLYNSVYPAEEWVRGFQASGACGYAKVQVADVFSDIPPTVPGYSPLEVWRYQEEVVCPGIDVVHFQGWGKNPSTPPTVREQVDFYENTQISKPGITATTLIIPHCPPYYTVTPGAHNDTGWWYFIDDGTQGRVFTAQGIEIDPDSCAANLVEDEGTHSCRSICDGDTNRPCKRTPGNDCSIPFDPNVILDTNVDETTRNEIAIYLANLMRHSIVTKGFTFEVDITLSGEACQDPKEYCRTRGCSVQAVESRCASAEGHLTSYYQTGPETNTHPAPHSATNVDLNRVQNSSNWATYTQSSDQFNWGFLDKIETPTIEWTLLAKSMRFKEMCYTMNEDGRNDGRVLRYVEYGDWGHLRCVNFVKLNCPNCVNRFDNERTLFFYDHLGYPGPMYECIHQPLNTFDESLCDRQFAELPRDVQSVIDHTSSASKKLPATFPIIGATDIRASLTDKNNEVVKGNIWLRTQSVITQYLYKLRMDELNFHTTNYYLYPEVLGQDTKLANARAYDLTMLPEFHRDNRPTTILDELKDIASGILIEIVSLISFFNKDTEFNCAHLPGIENIEDCHPDVFQGKNIDPRFVVINRFLNRDDNRNDCAQKPDDFVDRTNNTSPKELEGDSRVSTNLTTFEKVNLAEILNLNGPWGLTSENELHYFLGCEIFPDGLEEANEDAKGINDSYALPEYASTYQEMDERMQIAFDQNSGFVEGRIEAPQTYCSNSTENYKKWQEYLLCTARGESGTPTCPFPPNPEQPCCDVAEDAAVWNCVDNSSVTSVEMSLRSSFDNPSSSNQVCTITDSKNSYNSCMSITGAMPVEMFHNVGMTYLQNPDCASTFHGYENGLPKGLLGFVNSDRCGGKAGPGDSGSTPPPSDTGICENGKTPAHLPREDIPYRNTSINPLPIEQLIEVMQPGPGGFAGSYIPTLIANIEAHYTEIDARCRARGYNPAFCLATWLEESAAGSLSTAEFGTTAGTCRGFENSFNCFLNTYDTYLNLWSSCHENSTTVSFKEYTLHFSEGSCDKIIAQNYSFCENINYPSRIVRFYDAVTKGTW